MKDLTSLDSWTDKQLRTLRNNLNNRLASFTANETPKALQASHALAGLSQSECTDLLAKVKQLMSKRASKD